MQGFHQLLRLSRPELHKVGQALGLPSCSCTPAQLEAEEFTWQTTSSIFTFHTCLEDCRMCICAYRYLYIYICIYLYMEYFSKCIPYMIKIENIWKIEKLLILCIIDSWAYSSIHTHRIRIPSMLQEHRLPNEHQPRQASDIAKKSWPKPIRQRWHHILRPHDIELSESPSWRVYQYTWYIMIRSSVRCVHGPTPPNQKVWGYFLVLNTYLYSSIKTATW